MLIRFSALTYHNYQTDFLRSSDYFELFDTDRISNLHMNLLKVHQHYLFGKHSQQNSDESIKPQSYSFLCNFDTSRSLMLP